ncbi:hypothetical protein [Pseudoflavitalea rhizosphaerae]|uniref:hypothetical protein n=1 Tax=Pseudoflavitalea rhizosphaerae TaxID=1884793 RepID=UPI000F8C6D65|nr:hypothetical protein [Pseudoflavitalea rhizosphaerae]
MIKSIAKGINLLFGGILKKNKVFVSNSLEFLHRERTLDKNYFDYVRLSMLELISFETNNKKLQGNVAELDVYKGKFARYINQYFSDTSVEAVLKQMPFPNQCKPHPFMKKSFKLILLTLWFFPLFAVARQTVDFPEKIGTARTSRHINIPGTRVFLAIPSGFAPSSKQGMLRKDKLNAIDISDSVGDNYFDFDWTRIKGFYESKGAKVLSTRTLIVQGYSGFHLSMQASPNTITHMLVFGDYSFCTRIITVTAGTDKKAEMEIVEMLKNIWYAKAREMNPEAAAGFVLDTKESRLSYHGYNTNKEVYAYFYTGVQYPTLDQYPFVLISRVPENVTGTLAEISTLTDNLMVSQYAIINPLKKNVSSQKINGFDAYQAELHGQINTTNVVLYYLLITDGKKTFHLLGLARNELDKNLAEFRKLAGTMKLK